MTMNPFEQTEIASRYEAWYQHEGQRADHLERHLLDQLLRNFPRASSLLDVGCGTGHFTRWFASQGLQATGIDRSTAMLHEACALGSMNIVRGSAEELPFTDHSFDLVTIITALEFVADQAQAVREAWRVSRHGLLLGVLNANSQMGRAYRRAGGPIWQAAQLLTVTELRHLVRQQLGANVVIHWKTTLSPRWPTALPLPWGGFIGMAVQPDPNKVSR